MYSLDVNFLNDRPDYRPPDQSAAPKSRPTGSMTPLIIGVVVGLLLPGLVGGFWLYVQQQTAQLKEQEADLDSQIARLNIEQQKVKKLDDEIAQVRSDTKDLSSVFDQIKPWSAMLQDIRERTPAGLRIVTIQQKQAPATAASNAQAAKPVPAGKAAPNAKPSPAGKAAPNAKPSPAATPVANNPSQAMQLEISGRARSFDEVNYFLLTLQRSPFLKTDETQLVSAQLQTNANKLEVNRTDAANQSSGRVTYQLPKDVNYTIQTSLSDSSASDLLRELDRKGAVGLVTRLRTLQQIQEQGGTKP